MRLTTLWLSDGVARADLNAAARCGSTAMRSLLLSLDPPTAPPVVATPLSLLASFFESYGWFLLIGGMLLYVGFKQYQGWAERRRRAALEPADPAAHAEEVAMKVRQARLAQQAAWASAAPSVHRASRTQTDEEKRLQHLYGLKPPAAAEPDVQDRLTMDEVFGSNFDSEFYRGLKKRKNGKPRDDSASSSSSSASSSSAKSGFNPYKGGGNDRGGGSRRFGSGGPKKGG